MNDISNGTKFLGNIILSARNEKDFYIIDGQQRIVSLNMLVNYIKFNYGTQIDDVGELVEIKLNCFDLFKEFQENQYSLNNVDDLLCEKIKESDKLKQVELLEQLYSSINKSNVLDAVDKARKF